VEVPVASRKRRDLRLAPGGAAPLGAADHVDVAARDAAGEKQRLSVGSEGRAEVVEGRRDDAFAEELRAVGPRERGQKGTENDAGAHAHWLGSAVSAGLVENCGSGTIGRMGEVRTMVAGDVGGIEVMFADYRWHSFPPHFHDAYSVSVPR